MGWRQVAFPLLVITPSGGFTGLFVYNGPPGPGRLLFSVTAHSGTDPFGNPFLVTMHSYLLGVPANQLAGGFDSSTLNFTTVNPASLMALDGVMALLKDPLAVSDAPAMTWHAPTVLGSNNSAAVTIGLRSTSQDSSNPLQMVVNPTPFSAWPGTTSALVEVRGTLGVVGPDGNTYDTERLSLTLAASQLVSSVTPTSVNFSPAVVPLEASTTYRMTGCIFYTPTTATSNGIFSFLSAASFTSFLASLQETITSLNSAAAPSFGNGDIITLRTGTFATAGFASTAPRKLEVDITVITGAASSLGLEVACANAADTFTILAGSYLDVWPVFVS